MLSEELPPWARLVAALVRSEGSEVELALLIGPGDGTVARTAIAMVNEAIRPDELDILASIACETSLRLAGIPQGLIDAVARRSS
jgi:hypothetical protein